MLFAVFFHKSYFWEKFYSWDIGQNALSQSDYRIFKSAISPEQINGKASFLGCWYKFTKLRVDQKIFDWAWSKMGVANLVLGLSNWLYIKNEQMELTDFLQGGTNLYKLKGDWKFMVLHGKNGCDQSDDGTQKLAVSEQWTGGVNLFFACWCRFTKTKSRSKSLWAGMVNFGCS